MDATRLWVRFVDVAAVVWAGLFAIQVASWLEALHLAPSTADALGLSLKVLLPVFVLDVLLRYRWSAEGPRAFARSNWLRILAVVPWARPVRVLRIGRGLRAVRVLVGTRRVGGFVTKVRRMARGLWRRVRDAVDR